MNRCLKCNGILETADVNGICSKCRSASYSETSTPLVDVQKYVFYDNFEPYRNLLIKQAKKTARRKIYERKAKRSNLK